MPGTAVIGRVGASLPAPTWRSDSEARLSCTTGGVMAEINAVLSGLTFGSKSAWPEDGFCRRECLGCSVMDDIASHVGYVGDVAAVWSHFQGTGSATGSLYLVMDVTWRLVFQTGGHDQRVRQTPAMCPDPSLARSSQRFSCRIRRGGPSAASRPRAWAHATLSPSSGALQP